MRRSGRSNVVTRLTSKAFGVRSLAAVKPTAFRFCAIRLAMPFARLSDRLDAQNAQIVSDRVLSRPGWSDVVFAFHDAEEIGPRIHVFSIRCWMPARRSSWLTALHREVPREG